MITSQSDQLVAGPHSPSIEPIIVRIEILSVNWRVEHLKACSHGFPQVFEVVVESYAIKLGQMSSSSWTNQSSFLRGWNLVLVCTNRVTWPMKHRRPCRSSATTKR